MDDEVDAILDARRDPSGPDVIHAGSLPAGCLAHWASRATDEAVITRNRRDHYLANHPEIVDIERALLLAVRFPNEIHVNKNDPSMAIVYRRLDESHWIRVALLTSRHSHLKNSVISCRIAGFEEILEGRRSGRRVWIER
jgi:hypothetical protein